MTDTAVQDEPSQKATPPPDAETPKEAEASETLVSAPGDIAFNDDITLHPGRRLSQFDKGPVKAYAASGLEKAPANLFVLVCEDTLTPRISRIPTYASISNPSMARLVATGTVYWEPAGRERYCFIYENNLGNPFKKNDLQGGMDLRQETVLNRFIRPVVAALADMRDRDITHGCLRLSNIYDGGVAGGEKVILGDCLSVPSSAHMPVLYEPIERAMAHPTGRKSASFADDLYAFGVCLAIMLRGNDPLEGMSDDEIINLKIEEGSYVALTGRERFTGALLELLRGLLYDDPDQRWTLSEVQEWLDGRRLSPKQSARSIKASRPLLFNGKKYLRPEMLAKDLPKNPAEARQIVESGEMEQWLSRAIENKMIVSRYDTALGQVQDSAREAGYTDNMVTRIALALDPQGPIRYKNLRVHPEGIGTALTEAVVLKKDLQTYTDFFFQYFITQWVDMQYRPVTDVSQLIAKFDGARAHLRQKGMGGGIERCAYALNPDLHCLSEKLHRYFVRSPEDMLVAFEKMSSDPGRPALFFDRHIVAFIAVKDRKIIDPYLIDLNSSDQYKRVLAELKVLATIQKRSRMPNFPGIAGWFLDNLETVYERFHDRELRDSTRKKAERLRLGGDLSKILSLFDSPLIYEEDNTGFRRAMRKYYDLESEYIDLDTSLQTDTNFGRDTGMQAAAVVSAILAGIVVIATLLTFAGG